MSGCALYWTLARPTPDGLMVNVAGEQEDQQVDAVLVGAFLVAIGRWH